MVSLLCKPLLLSQYNLYILSIIFRKQVYSICNTFLGSKNYTHY